MEAQGYRPLEEIVYVKLPIGSARKLRKVMCDLKQAARQRYGRFHNSIFRVGLEGCQGNPCCYMKPLKIGDDPLFVLIHLDIAIVTGKDPNENKGLKQTPNKEYVVTYLGLVHHCLGWKINQDREQVILITK